MILVCASMVLFANLITDPFEGIRSGPAEIILAKTFKEQTTIITIFAIVAGAWWHRTTWLYNGLRRPVTPYVTATTLLLLVLVLAPPIVGRSQRETTVNNFKFDQPGELDRIGKFTDCGGTNVKCADAGSGYQYKAFYDYDGYRAFVNGIQSVSPQGKVEFQKTRPKSEVPPAYEPYNNGQ